METLQQLIGRIEGLLAEKGKIQELITEAFAEARAEGYDTNVMRKVIALRAMDEAIMEVYLRALGEADGEI